MQRRVMLVRAAGGGTHAATRVDFAWLCVLADCPYAGLLSLRRLSFFRRNVLACVDHRLNAVAQYVGRALRTAFYAAVGHAAGVLRSSDHFGRGGRADSVDPLLPLALAPSDRPVV